MDGLEAVEIKYSDLRLLKTMRLDNEYFSKEYSVSRRTISRNVKALQERGLIKVEVKINEYGCRLRYITPLQKMESVDMVEKSTPKKKDYSYLD